MKLSEYKSLFEKSQKLMAKKEQLLADKITLEQKMETYKSKRFIKICKQDIAKINVKVKKINAEIKELDEVMKNANPKGFRLYVVNSVDFKNALVKFFKQKYNLDAEVEEYEDEILGTSLKLKVNEQEFLLGDLSRYGFDVRNLLGREFKTNNSELIEQYKGLDTILWSLVKAALNEGITVEVSKLKEENKANNQQIKNLQDDSYIKKLIKNLTAENELRNARIAMLEMGKDDLGGSDAKTKKARKTQTEQLDEEDVEELEKEINALIDNVNEDQSTEAEEVAETTENDSNE